MVGQLGWLFVLVGVSWCAHVRAAAPDRRIAVLPSRPSEEVDRSLAAQFDDAFTEEVRRRSGAEVPSQRRIDMFLELAGRELARCRDRGCYAELGASLDVDTLVTIEVARIEGRWLVSAELFDLLMADVVERTLQKSEGSDAAALMALAPLIAADLLGRAARSPSISPGEVVEPEPEALDYAERTRKGRAEAPSGQSADPQGSPPAGQSADPQGGPPARRCRNGDDAACAKIARRVAAMSDEQIWDACSHGQLPPACEALMARGGFLPFGRGARIAGGILMGIGALLTVFGGAVLSGDDAQSEALGAVSVAYGVVAGVSGAIVYGVGAYRGSRHRWHKLQGRRRSRWESLESDPKGLGLVFSF